METQQGAKGNSLSNPVFTRITGICLFILYGFCLLFFISGSGVFFSFSVKMSGFFLLFIAGAVLVAIPARRYAIRFWNFQDPVRGKSIVSRAFGFILLAYSLAAFITFLVSGFNTAYLLISIISIAMGIVQVVNGFLKHSVTGKFVSYSVFALWTLITVVPLVWMMYSSFKSNEELTLDIYSFPHALFDNYNDEYVVIKPELNVVLDYDPEVDKRERLIIESTTIAPTRRLMYHILLKQDLPPAIANLVPGDTLQVNQLPPGIQFTISMKTIWFNFISSMVRGKLYFGFINSILYAGIATFFIVMFGLMIGFALSKLKFPRLSYFIGGLIGIGYLLTISSVIIPLFLILSGAQLKDTHLGIILVYIAFGLPMSVLLSTQFISGLPNSLIESAQIDGASTFRTFLSIITPMSVPVAVTVAILNALGIWNEFLLVLVLASSEFTKSLPVGVYSFSSLQSTQFGWQLAALVIALLPAMIIYFIFNRQIAKGVVAGAIKG